MVMTTHYFSRCTFWCAPMLLSVCMVSTAQTMDAPNTNAAKVADPHAVVPAVPYRSVFKDTSLGVEKDTRDWRKANDEVGKFTRGHVDILKWEEQEGAKTMKGTTDKPVVQPSATKPSTAPAHKH
jgi:hypothetical protein